MKKQQTAVDWLVQKLHNLLELYPSEWKKLNEVIEAAKQMERKQIIDAHLLGLIYPLEIEATKQAEQYYNETYGDELNKKSI